MLEQHGYPPLVISFESIDELDHVIFVYQSDPEQGPESRVRGSRVRWGSVARSRDPGLHGRKPVFATPRALAASYLDTYVDLTGRIKAFALVDLRVMGTYDWRLADRNVWKVERMLLETKHQPLRMPEARFPRFSQALSRVQRAASRPQAAVLRRAGQVDTDSETLPGCE